MTALPPVDASRHVDVRKVHGWLADRTDDLVADLVRLAEQETPSDDLALLADGRALVEQLVTDRLGAPAERILHPSDEHGDVLVLDYPGAAPRRVVALAHYDTVFDAGTLASWPVRVDGDRVTGPGVFDMKGGLVQLLWALRALDALGVERPAVRLVLNGDEEIGSPFSRPVLESASEGADAALVLEASADGAVKTARKGVGLFELTARGIESHAGLDPAAGASAIGELARAVVALHDGADLSRGTSINVGTVRGGTRANVVAGHGHARIDVRVASTAEQQRVDALLASIGGHDPRVTLEVSGGWNRPVLERSAGVAHLYALARALATQLDVDLAEASVGGASDGNFVAALGIPVLDGIGAVGGGAHTRQEWTSVAGMVERSALVAGVLAAFGV